MPEITKIYSPKEIESKWYSYWLEKNFFRSMPDDREPYTIVIPPPNVTGVLHMGHVLNNTIQDVLIRRARMMGKNACWVPGTDHASIATEAKVVILLKEKGISKANLTREEFLKYAWEWKEKYGGIILEQLKKLGCSCDWERTRFTMENSLSEAVNDVFIDLYNKGYIYRGYRMVNWDPVGMTALSDEEVIYKEVNSKLFFVRYKIENTTSNSQLPASDYITIATTRPETILGDTAICVHPKDERYKNLIGKKAIVPLVNRIVPVIADEYVDIEFGTGALKITPAHDANDYKLGLKHKLGNLIDILNPNGTINAITAFDIPIHKAFMGESLDLMYSKKAKEYDNLDRFIARKKIIKDLEELGQLVKTDDIKNKVGYSERTDAVIEPKLSQQWFLKMEKISKPALENVRNGEIKLIPDKFINTYKHWMENVHDWCISRQLWWGHRIPAWYDEKGNFVVAKTEADAKKLFKLRTPNSEPRTLKQEEDVLDTWFSSWLWPISVFDGFKEPNNKDINYYYPTNDLVTAPEILFFWVARMIIAGYEYRKEKPFRNVYLTGIVRDKSGRKMSKSLGNSPEPFDLIEKYGADGVRVGMLLCSPAGNDLLFDKSYCEQGRNFCNKIWNAFRLVNGWTADDHIEQPQGNKISVEWFDAKLNEQLVIINDLYEKYKISEALMATYKLIWDDFCAWYLEMIKPEFADRKLNRIDKATYDTTIGFFEKLLKILHPFIPFITEEIWHLLRERKEKEYIIIADWPELKNYDKKIVKAFEGIKVHITSIRNIRKSQNIPTKEKIELHAKSNPNSEYKEIVKKFDAIVIKMCCLSVLNHNSERIENAISFTSLLTEFFIPRSKNINITEEKERLTKELEYYKGFLQSVRKKLSNEHFVQNAKPEVIKTERKKQADAEVKIKTIEEQLNHLLNTN